jgi:hypothetical protein
MAIYENVLIAGGQHFGSGGFSVACDLRGGAIVPGTVRRERTSFIWRDYATVEAPDAPVSVWSDVLRDKPQRITYTARG